MKQHGWKDKNILLPLSELSLASKQCWAAVRSSGKSLLFADHCSIWFFTEARTYKIKKGKKGMNEQIPYSPCCDACMKDPHLHLILRSISGNVWKMWLDHPNHFMKYLHYTWNQHAVIAMQVLLWNNWYFCLKAVRDPPFEITYETNRIRKADRSCDEHSCWCEQALNKVKASSEITPLCVLIHQWNNRFNACLSKTCWWMQPGRQKLLSFH